LVTFKTQLNVNTAQKQRMTERNQLTRAFGRLNAGDPRYRKYITFRVSTTGNQLSGLGKHMNPCLSHGFSGRYAFIRNIDHSHASQ
jgi:hypothetical protein